MAGFGVPSVFRLAEIVGKGEKQPKEWVDNIIAKAIPAYAETIARYRWLDAEQVEALLALRDYGTNSALVSNADVQLDSRQLDAMLGSAPATEIVRERFESLSEAQRQRLKKNPDLALAMRLRGSGADAAAAFEFVVREQGNGKALWALQMLPDITGEIVDVVLEYGSDDLRRSFAMKRHLQFTPQQIERMLQDRNPEVRIGILRRRDIALTVEQVAHGINHPNENLAFWYRQRSENYVPTAEEIEASLTSASVGTRSWWVSNRRFTLTPGQAARALADPAPVVRQAALGRPELLFGESEQNACTNDPDFSVRSICVSRPDYTLTQARFESIASDRNQNLLRAFLNRKGVPKTDLGPYVEEAVRNASDATLQAIAANKEVPFTPLQIGIACQARSGKTQNAFCCRVPPR